jgi:hypothetical protein
VSGPHLVALLWLSEWRCSVHSRSHLSMEMWVQLARGWATPAASKDQLGASLWSWPPLAWPLAFRERVAPAPDAYHMACPFQAVMEVHNHSQETYNSKSIWSPLFYWPL